jgi:hypothetical protein
MTVALLVKAFQFVSLIDTILDERFKCLDRKVRLFAFYEVHMAIDCVTSNPQIMAYRSVFRRTDGLREVSPFVQYQKNFR